MKKDVVMILVSLFFLIGAGCEQSTIPELNSFEDWSDSLPLYYLENGVNDVTKTALEKNDIEECNAVMIEPISPEKIKTYLACKTAMAKQEAFLKKDYEKCKEFYSEEDKKEYEECMAPIVAYSAISSKDKSQCGTYLTNARLTELCEVDYENYA